VRGPDGAVAYQVVGDGPIDVVLVWGWLSNLEGNWDNPALANLLSGLSSFCRLILFDKRGTGLSDRFSRSAPTLEERMDDVRVVLDAVGSERAALLGHWEGGPMSILFAATFPERTSALILYGSYATWVQREPDHPWGIRPDGVGRVLESTLATWGDDEYFERYIRRVAPSMVNDTAFKGNTDVIIRNNSSEGLPQFQWSGSLPAASTPTTQEITLGLFAPVPSVAAIATHVLNRTDNGIVDGTYLVFADQGCPDGNDACVDGEVLCLGTDQTWDYKLAHSKVTVGHEFGHVVMAKLMGTLGFTYSDSATQWQCRCDHVTTGSQEHCLQSRENLGAAQNEGWGHFHAADLYNNPGDTNMSFAYYKEFAVDFHGQPIVISPPVVVSTYSPIRWMTTYCPSTSRGTELDWLGFYWWVHGKGGSNKYTYADFNTVYRRACTGGSAKCSGQTPSWNNLVTAVNALAFSTAKKDHWINTAANYGVNF